MRPRRAQLAYLAELYRLNYDELLVLAGYPNPHSDLSLAASECLAEGKINDAYRLARQLSRNAQKTNNHADYLRAQELMKEALKDVDQFELERIAFRDGDKFAIEQLRTLAKDRADFPSITFCNRLILQLSTLGSEDYRRAQRNLATIAHIVGDFTTSEQYAVEGMRMAEVHHEDQNYQFLYLTMLSARYYAGFVDTHYRTYRPTFWNPYVWRMYWWWATHSAWTQEDWSFVFDAVTHARDTYDPSWHPAGVYELEGVASALAIHQGSTAQKTLAHLAELIITPLGLSYDIAENLEEDFVHLAIAHNHPDATIYWLTILLRANHQRRTGWVNYWRHHAPPILQWDRVPILMRREYNELIAE